jgi:hypothetical protein
MNRHRGAFEHLTRVRPHARHRGSSRKDVSEVAEERFRGASVRSLPRPNRQYSEGRVCAHPGCETKLSRYNKWQYCWQHEPVHTYIPRGKRRSKRDSSRAA